VSSCNVTSTNRASYIECFFAVGEGHLETPIEAAQRRQVMPAGKFGGGRRVVGLPPTAGRVVVLVHHVGHLGDTDAENEHGRDQHDAADDPPSTGIRPRR
jgi:hypothetical protein